MAGTMFTLFLPKVVSNSISLDVFGQLLNQNREFQDTGFMVLRSVLPLEDVRACKQHLSRVIWGQPRHERPLEKGMITSPGRFLGSKQYSLIGDGFDLRTAPRWIRNSTYRLNFGDSLSLWDLSNPWARLAHNANIQAAVRLLIDSRDYDLSGLIFERGSQQDLHEDTWYGLGGSRFGGMVGVWFALDDVDDANGPLIYVPGSHKLLSRPEKNFSDHKLRYVRLAFSGRHGQSEAAYAEEKAYVSQAKVFHAKLGDVGIWHERLLHGGAAIIDQSRTRLSMVVHYKVRKT
eukprot:gnl/MRDRNA2_/MRDRNA2_41401_c0_seq1.p1 gnl/MRDRNA2_/MRDRNA2_41401_c0~~gnl/MRDRNA2_/MRDRNA2_41401_c0_seq1.p1  ORF type:complete len:316 (+),score=26.78 gnl/MRDRNA2_/MRDRNA2_41401_c0_seq1:81-950(+)